MSLLFMSEEFTSHKIALGTKAFKAKGSNVLRCQGCMLAQSFCICSEKKIVTSTATFCLLTHHVELFKPTNTGRLIGHVLTNTHYFTWFRTEPDPDFEALIASNKYQPYLIFPANNEVLTQRAVEFPVNSLSSLEREEVKPPLFILLDGTWRQAAKMVRSSWLKNLPILPLSIEKTSRYKLRKAQHEHQLCTVEVAIELLDLAGDHIAKEALNKYFDVFNQQYALSRRQS
jgi:DTW domain-containing protein YfiP